VNFGFTKQHVISQAADHGPPTKKPLARDQKTGQSHSDEMSYHAIINNYENRGCTTHRWRQKSLLPSLYPFCFLPLTAYFAFIAQFIVHPIIILILLPSSTPSRY